MPSAIEQINKVFDEFENLLKTLHFYDQGIGSVPFCRVCFMKSSTVGVFTKT